MKEPTIKFTNEMLERAGDKMPGDEDSIRDWFAERGFNETAIERFMEAVTASRLSGGYGLSHTTVTSNGVVGIMIGIELGRLMCDPSFKLAAEMSG